jgi:hypothetical protein
MNFFTFTVYPDFIYFVAFNKLPKLPFKEMLSVEYLQVLVGDACAGALCRNERHRLHVHASFGLSLLSTEH